MLKDSLYLLHGLWVTELLDERLVPLLQLAHPLQRTAMSTCQDRKKHHHHHHHYHHHHHHIITMVTTTTRPSTNATMQTASPYVLLQPELAEDVLRPPEVDPLVPDLVG